MKYIINVYFIQEHLNIITKIKGFGLMSETNIISICRDFERCGNLKEL